MPRWQPASPEEITRRGVPVARLTRAALRHLELSTSRTEQALDATLALHRSQPDT